MVATPSELVERARERTGLTDLGADGWREGLEKLVAAVAVDLEDEADAMTRVESMILARLVARLKIESWYDQHGSEAAHAVEGPIVIVGLPRSGTTALHHLLAVDSRFRYPRTWEISDPVPPPELATEASDPRRPTWSGGGDVRHISAPDGPTEDGQLHALDFRHQEAGLPVPTYTAWWRSADLTTTFAYHERVLRLLQSHRPPYLWLLKAPAYLFHLEQLVAQYPDARFLMTHRDPGVAIPSTCSTIEDARQRLIPGWSPEPATFGREVLNHFVVGMDRAIVARAELGEQRFLDVAQHDLETDTVGTAERIYEFLGLHLSPELRSRMDEWAIENRRGARGEHRYSATDYGLTAESIRARFDDYLHRFGPLVRTAG